MSDNQMITVDREAFDLCLGKAVHKAAAAVYGEKLCHGLFIDELSEKVVAKAWGALAELHDENQLLEEDVEVMREAYKEGFKAGIISKLWKDAKYAADSFDLCLLYQAYGELNMVLHTGTVSYEEVREISEYIVRDHINNGEWRRECDRRYDCNVQ